MYKVMKNGKLVSGGFKTYEGARQEARYLCRNIAAAKNIRPDPFEYTWTIDGSNPNHTAFGYVIKKV